MSTFSGIASAFFVATSIAAPTTLPLKDFGLNSINSAESKEVEDKNSPKIGSSN
jgi:hypothetical protein